MISFIVPTYKRLDLLKRKTLKMLNSYNIPSRDIFLFVANKEEERIYRSGLGDKYKIIVGVKGLGNQRNFIVDYFKEGSKLVFMDDDIDLIHELKGDKQVRLPNFMEFCKSAFKECEAHNSYIWGVYPSDNGFFQKRNITYDRRFLVGPLFGVINRHDKDLKLSISKNDKEDSERTLRYFKKDGVVVRYNYISVKTRFFAKGGITALDHDRIEQSKLDVFRLKKAFGNAVDVVEPTKSNKYWELKIHRK